MYKFSYDFCVHFLFATQITKFSIDFLPKSTEIFYFFFQIFFCSDMKFKLFLREGRKKNCEKIHTVNISVIKIGIFLK